MDSCCPNANIIMSYLVPHLSMDNELCASPNKHKLQKPRFVSLT